MEPIAVYVHIPFCPSKCGYCDFNSYAMQGDIVGQTVDAIVRDIESSPIAGVPAKTIFFGGGTPTFLEAGQLLRVFEAVLETHPPIQNAEITSEANPGTVDAQKFVQMKRAGFNRISLGAQSFNKEDLLRLERVHEPGDIERSVAAAREAGFDNINVDLMFALPLQNFHGWRQNLHKAINLGTAHLSLYCLTIEPGTSFFKRYHRGELELAPEDQQVEMYELAIEACREAGLEQYEISNFAKPGKECLHNLEYWRARPYAAYGPGAVSCLVDSEGTTVRETRIKHPRKYSEALEAGESPVAEAEALAEQTLELERIMLGLRLSEGVSANRSTLDEKGVEFCQESGWIEAESDTIRLTPAGRHFCSEVVARITS
ncbi:MAG: radical SAM family heme chaperone HemW [Fimbriimonadaceae bacterium]